MAKPKSKAVPVPELPPLPLPADLLDSPEHIEHRDLAAQSGAGLQVVLARAKGVTWLIEHGLASEWPAAAPAKPEAPYVPQGQPTLKYINEQRVAAKDRPPARAVTVCMEDVIAEGIEWLFPGRIPLGTVSMIGGDPGAGKSTLTGLLATTVSIGGCWPDEPGEHTEVGNVLILTAEENLANAVRPRLDRMGADLSRIHVLTTIEQSDGRLTPFSLTRDIPLLEQACERLGDVRLIIIDPIGSYLSGADSHSDCEVREAVNPLFKLAEKHRCAVLLIAHLNKGAGTNVLYRFSGSIAFAGTSRMVWFLSRHPTDRTRRVMSFVKGNPPDATTTALSFGFLHGQILWDAEPLDWMADDVARLLQAESEKLCRKPARGPDAKKIVEAEAFLLDLLKSGPCLKAAAHEKGFEQNLKESTLRRAIIALKERGLVEQYPHTESRAIWIKLSDQPALTEGRKPLPGQASLPGLA